MYHNSCAESLGAYQQSLTTGKCLFSIDVSRKCGSEKRRVAANINANIYIINFNLHDRFNGNQLNISIHLENKARLEHIRVASLYRIEYSLASFLICGTPTVCEQARPRRNHRSANSPDEISNGATESEIERENQSRSNLTPF